MKKLALLLLCLIANSSCLYMTIVSPEQYHVLTPEVNEDSYFYLLTENFFSTAKVYLYFRDQRSHFKYNELEICYTDENPKSKTAVSNCRFRWINYYRATTDKNGDKYYYSFDYYDRYSFKQLYKKYIIVHFKTDKQYSQGPILTVKASTKDIYNEESNKDVQKIFSIIYVIFLLICPTIILVAIILSIIFCCICCKNQRTVGMQGYPAPQPNMAFANPIIYPLAPPAGNYAINDPNALLQKPSPIVNPV